MILYKEPPACILESLEIDAPASSEQNFSAVLPILYRKEIFHYLFLGAVYRQATNGNTQTNKQTYIHTDPGTLLTLYTSKRQNSALIAVLISRNSRTVVGHGRYETCWIPVATQPSRQYLYRRHAFRPKVQTCFPYRKRSKLGF